MQRLHCEEGSGELRFGVDDFSKLRGLARRPFNRSCTVQLPRGWRLLPKMLQIPNNQTEEFKSNFIKSARRALCRNNSSGNNGTEIRSNNMAGPGLLITSSHICCRFQTWHFLLPLSHFQKYRGFQQSRQLHAINSRSSPPGASPTPRRKEWRKSSITYQSSPSFCLSGSCC